MGFWQQAGKPDFARCAELISRFDPELRESLSRSEGKVLQWILFYAWAGGERSPQAGSYTSFSQIAVGKKLQRSRWTVMRALERLSARGLISSLRRRPSSTGVYSTNLYFLGDKLKAILARILNKVRDKSPCSKTAPQVFRKNTTKAGAPPTGCAASQDKDIHDGHDAGHTQLRAFLERWKALLPGSGLPDRLDASA